MIVLIAIICGLGAGVVLRWAIVACLAIADGFAQRRAMIDPADVEPLTVVVPAWNEGAVIARTLDALLACDLPSLHVIVVDDGSTDDTLEVVRAYPEVQLLVQPVNQGKSAALNRGLREAQTRLVLTVDADTLVAPDAPRWLVATQRSTHATAVAANVRVGNRDGMLTRWQSLEYVAGLNLDRRALHQLGIITTVPGATALWVRQAVLGVGGFSGATLAEDTDLSLTLLRKGHALAYQDRADAFTEAPTRVGELWKQRRRWLAGNLACLFQHRLGGDARPLVRWVALPNLWFAHVGVYLIPWFVSGLLLFVPPQTVAPVLGALGTAALCLDVGCVLGAYAVDRADPRDLLYLPVQRMLYPWFMMGVFLSVCSRPPRTWAKISRKNTALLG